MVKNLDYDNWNNSKSLINKELDLTIVPEIGGRIISLKYKGMEFFRQNSASMGLIATPGDNWLNWGGSFDWIGPQSSWNTAGWPPPFELDSGEWQLLNFSLNAIELASNPTQAGISLKKKIILENNIVTIIRSITNVSDIPLNYGLWNIVQVNTDGSIRIPAPAKSLSNIKIFDSPISDMAGLLRDEIIDFSLDKQSFFINPGKGKFKLGLFSEYAVIEYFLNNYKFSLISSANSPGDFPHQCNIEIYRDFHSGYTELEQLWEMSCLQPGQSFCASQRYVFEG